jgi:RNA polymerase sigma-70 factor (ECF subfamily)
LTRSEQWAAWMGGAQAGDQEAYRCLLSEIQAVLFRYVRRRLGSDAAADDVCQEILLTMHRVRHTYEPGRPFEPWMYAIAKSRLIDHVRKERRMRMRQVDVDAVPDLADEPMGRGGSRLLEAVNKLPESQREAFRMLKVEGLSAEDAAQRAGVSVTALKVRAHRAYKTIKRAMAEGEER